MKKLILLTACILLTTIVFSQENKDVVYLKNGSVVKGLIIEQVPNEHIKIMTNDGNIFVFKYSEIEKITKEAEELNLDEYGGQISYGIAIGGGGIVGVPVRYYLNPKTALEAGAFYRMTIDLDNETSTGGIMIAGGPIIYLDKSYNSFKEKIISNGITLKAGYSFSDYKETMFALAWARESFKKRNKKNSFVFELGAGVLNYLDSGDMYYPNGSKTQPLLYWKVHWSWYGK